MKKKNQIKAIILAVIFILILWTAMGLTDYVRVSNFEKPVFCRLDSKTAYDDGGSGKYNGLGYSVEIVGNFMPESDNPGVIRYIFRIFGSEIKSGTKQ